MKNKNMVPAIIMVLAILISIPLGANRSFARLRSDAEDAYYYDNTGYAIYEGLENRVAAANNLLTLAQKYEEQYSELDPLIDGLEYRVKLMQNQLYYIEKLPQVIAANRDMGDAAQALADALEQIELAEKDEKYPRQLIADLESEQDKLERSSYNDEAREYNARLTRFPINFLKGIARIREMGVFEKE